MLVFAMSTTYVGAASPETSYNEFLIFICSYFIVDGISCCRFRCRAFIEKTELNRLAIVAPLAASTAAEPSASQCVTLKKIRQMLSQHEFVCRTAGAPNASFNLSRGHSQIPIPTHAHVFTSNHYDIQEQLEIFI